MQPYSWGPFQPYLPMILYLLFFEWCFAFLILSWISSSLNRDLGFPALEILSLEYFKTTIQCLFCDLYCFVLYGFVIIKSLALCLSIFWGNGNNPVVPREGKSAFWGPQTLSACWAVNSKMSYYSHLGGEQAKRIPQVWMERFHLCGKVAINDQVKYY